MNPNAKENSFLFIGKTEIAEGKKMNLTGMASSEGGGEANMHAFSHAKILKRKKCYFSILFGSRPISAVYFCDSVLVT